jgi:hypothetical protein
MNAHIQDKERREEQALAEFERLFAAKLKAASTRGVMLGGHAAMKLAHDSFAPAILAATDYLTLRSAALELLDYLQDKASGLKKAAEPAADYANQDTLAPAT